MNGRSGAPRPGGAGRLSMVQRSVPTWLAWQWERLQGDHDYFCVALTHLFEVEGYQVLDQRVYRDPREEVTRECGFMLRRDSQQHIALGLRQDLVVTSDVVGRLGRVVQAGQADAGLIVTTSFFTDAAAQAARCLPLSLYDRQQLWRLLNLG
jgi:hypothetical protein